MTNEEIIKWCEEKGYPKKMAALLWMFTPDLDELEEWEFSYPYEFDHNIIKINDTKYCIFTKDELEQEEDRIMDDVEDRANEDIPEWLQPYVMWTEFWKDHPVIPDDVCFGMIRVNFEGEEYWYGEDL